MLNTQREPGGRINGASPAYNAEEMTHALKTADTKILFTLPGSLAVARAAARSAGLPASHVFLLEGSSSSAGEKGPDDDVDVPSLAALIERGALLPPTPRHRLPAGATNRDVCGYLNFSSGTTGLPKAVMLSHHNVIAQCLQLRQLQLLPPDGSGYRTVAALPLFHITGLVRFVTYPLVFNGHCALLPAFDLALLLDTLVARRVDELIAVPPILLRLARDQAVVPPRLPALRATLRRLSNGAAPVPRAVLAELAARFPGVGFRQGYGATESTACLSCHPPTHQVLRYAHAAGMLVSGTEARVVDLADPARRRALGVGQTGEICARGPQVAMGYLGDAAATAEAFDDEGFLHTGDVGHIDAEGMLHIEDRIKEMIKVKGTQVAPAELEDLLLGHGAVADCAVLGVADEYAGERPKAYVVLKQGVPATEEVGRRLLQYVRDKKVRFKWLVEVEFADSIPKGSTGKLLRRVLKVSDKDPTRKTGLRVYDETRRARL